MESALRVFFSFFYSVVFYSLTFLLKPRGDSFWSNDCLVDDCPWLQRFYTVIFLFWVVFPVNNAQLWRRRRAEGTDVIRKAWWVAQASNEPQNSFLKDFTFQLIPCSRNGAIVLLNSKDLFYCQCYSILENNPQLPPNERRIPIWEYFCTPTEPTPSQTSANLVFRSENGFWLWARSEIWISGSGPRDYFFEVFSFTKLDTKTLSAIPDVQIYVLLVYTTIVENDTFIFLDQNSLIPVPYPKLDWKNSLKAYWCVGLRLDWETIYCGCHSMVTDFLIDRQHLLMCMSDWLTDQLNK